MNVKIFSTYVTYKSLNITIQSNHELRPGIKNPVLFLHGFTGSSEDWTFLFPYLDSKYTLIAIDLPGHGKSGSPDNPKCYTEDFITQLLQYIFITFKIKKAPLIGYSLGGRLALSFLAKFPLNISGLFLESCSPGIVNSNERQKRVKADSALAETLIKGQIFDFIHNWMTLPLFQPLKRIKANDYTILMSKKIKNNPIGLYHMLKEFSPGKMRNHWNTIQNYNSHIYYVSGEVDKKYSAINTKLSQSNFCVKSFVINGSGHVVHVEKPAKYICLLKTFLKEGVDENS